MIVTPETTFFEIYSFDPEEDQFIVKIIPREATVITNEKEEDGNSSNTFSNID